MIKYKMMPIVMTAEMRQAWLNAVVADDDNPLDAGYRAMLDAAPTVEQNPIGYLAHRNGKPSWDDDCVCKDPVYPVDQDDDRVSVPIYTSQQDTPMVLPIALAPRDKTVLVNDCAIEQPAWVEAYWLESISPDGADSWSGWAYRDDLLNDAHPLGPRPTVFLNVPPPPAEPNQLKESEGGQ
jgi:hypothetical protein